MSTTVLLAAHEASSSILLARRLRAHGFEIVSPGVRADVVLAGQGPELEGFCAEAPVIVLGAADDRPDDRVEAFRRGCDDYVPRPFDYEELVERIRAVLRRSSRPSGRVLVAGELTVDEGTRAVTLRGITLRLSSKEFRLLAVLAADPDRVFSRNELLRDIWDLPVSSHTRTLDSHASRLRCKLRAVDPGTPYIDNEWGVGYRLVGPYPDSLEG
ncbi:MAG TPA: response regulator transcription factor [Gaiellaceae bacterium]|jgi:DNA-binding response OmpR family regulator|nr:response regulator transcription factor [Gaiellaceae bacterium]